MTDTAGINFKQAAQKPFRLNNVTTYYLYLQLILASVKVKRNEGALSSNDKNTQASKSACNYVCVV